MRGRLRSAKREFQLTEHRPPKGTSRVPRGVWSAWVLRGCWIGDGRMFLGCLSEPADAGGPCRNFRRSKVLGWSSTCGDHPILRAEGGRQIRSFGLEAEPSFFPEVKSYLPSEKPCQPRGDPRPDIPTGVGDLWEFTPCLGRRVKGPFVRASLQIARQT